MREEVLSWYLFWASAFQQQSWDIHDRWQLSFWFSHNSSSSCFSWHLVIFLRIMGAGRECSSWISTFSYSKIGVGIRFIWALASDNVSCRQQHHVPYYTICRMTNTRWPSSSSKSFFACHTCCTILSIFLCYILHAPIRFILPIQIYHSFLSFLASTAYILLLILKNTWN